MVVPLGYSVKRVVVKPEEGRRLDVGLAEVVVDAQESIVGLHGIQVGPVGRPGCDEDIEVHGVDVGRNVVVVSGPSTVGNAERTGRAVEDSG